MTLDGRARAFHTLAQPRDLSTSESGSGNNLWTAEALDYLDYKDGLHIDCSPRAFRRSSSTQRLLSTWSPSAAVASPLDEKALQFPAAEFIKSASASTASTTFLRRSSVMRLGCCQHAVEFAGRDLVGWTRASPHSIRRISIGGFLWPRSPCGGALAGWRGGMRWTYRPPGRFVTAPGGSDCDERSTAGIGQSRHCPDRLQSRRVAIGLGRNNEPTGLIEGASRTFDATLGAGHPHASAARHLCELNRASTAGQFTTFHHAPR